MYPARTQHKEVSDLVNDLSRVPFLSTLSESALTALVGRMKLRTYESGDVIYSEGAPGDALYFVKSGIVRVQTSAASQAEVLAHLHKGSSFGEAALLSDRPRPTAVVAATDCALLVLTRTAFQTFLNENPEAGQAVADALANRPPRSAQQQVTLLLKPMPVFADVAEEALVAVAQKLRPAHFRCDAPIFTEGEPSDALYLVELGRVRLLGGAATGRAVVREIGPGDFFGEDALIADEPRQVTAEAASDVELWMLKRADYEAILPLHPAAVLTMTRGFAARMERLNRQLLGLATSAQAVRPAARPVVSQARPAIAVPVPAMAVSRRQRPVQRQPLGPALRSWLAELGLAAKIRLAVIGALVVWLAVVSIPSAIAGSVTKPVHAGLAAQRSVVGVTARGAVGPSAAVPALAGAVQGNVLDAAEAPMIKLAELVTLKPSPVSQTAAPAPAQMPRTAPTPTPQAEVVYKVVAGDTLSAIAEQFGVDIEVLIEANDIADPALINIDQELIIPGGEEQAKIAARIAAAPRPTATPTPIPKPTPAAPAAPAAAAAKPALPFVWDGRLDKISIRLEPAQVAEGQQYWRLVKALYRDAGEPVPQGLPGGDHNIYVEVLDENGNRLLGQKVSVLNGGKFDMVMEKKPFPEYGANFPMYGMLGSYSVWVDGLPSDKVAGMGLPMKHHVSFFLTFQRTTK